MSRILEFRPVQPIGHRTCCDLASRTHSVEHVWLDDHVPEYVVEESQLKNGDLEPKLTVQQHIDALGAFNSLKRRAAKGQLPVDSTVPSPAKVMSRVPYIIELVPLLSGGRRPPRLFRLYYAEPASFEGGLLPLVLSTKPNDHDPYGEQNASIDEAGNRSRVWELLTAMKGKSR